ncbi:hypothetical protein [Anaerobaca lacustris]|uniref:Uncharacterized protein n=1 Tax=Anaerobaca lacustris TaxID=3044600 RepID=A0AAW6U3J8_9BACT|nr:hypothetical protein [Sedimentisphaerales bacterium M17dextr]
MPEHIPFVNSGNDLKRLREYYDKPGVAHVQLSNAASLRKRQIHHLCDLWIDPEIDGYDRLLKGSDARADWKNQISQFKENEILANEAYLKKPATNKVKVFIFDVLDKCHQFEPAWITVPQLPIVGDSTKVDNTRNRINTELAKASAQWRMESGFEGSFVLPLVFTHQSQLRGKTQWGPKLRLAKKCLNVVRPDIIWAVNCDLPDWKGSDKLKERFASLVSFHTDLRNAFPNAKIIAGPYWAMNLVLWSRGLCDYPAISLGHGFSYRVSGGYIPPEPPTAMVALGPLRRQARHTEQLRDWINNAVKKLQGSDEAAKQFSRLQNRFNELARYEVARNQVAEFYGDWLKKLSMIPPSGRSLALFQDMTSAYVLGKQLHNELDCRSGALPKSEAPAREPGKIAELFMPYCL